MTFTAETTCMTAKEEEALKMFERKVTMYLWPSKIGNDDRCLSNAEIEYCKRKMYGDSLRLRERVVWPFKYGEK